jgi:hypothetical protein
MDHDTYVEQPKYRRDSHEEVTHDNGLGVVSEKRRPALIATLLDASESASQAAR